MNKSTKKLPFYMYTIPQSLYYIVGVITFGFTSKLSWMRFPRRLGTPPQRLRPTQAGPGSPPSSSSVLSGRENAQTRPAGPHLPRAPGGPDGVHVGRCGAVCPKQRGPAGTRHIRPPEAGVWGGCIVAGSRSLVLGSRGRGELGEEILAVQGKQNYMLPFAAPQSWVSDRVQVNRQPSHERTAS